MSKSTSILIYLVFLGVFVGLGLLIQQSLMPAIRDQQKTLADVAKRLDRIEDSMALLHFRDDPTGKPVDAILEHVRFWSGQDEQFGGSIVEKPVIERQMQLGVRALRSLGPSAYDAVERAFFEVESDHAKTQFRKRLLSVLVKLDPVRAKQLLVSQLTTPARASQIRTKAGQLLIELDPTLAGAKLRSVILNETYKGVRHTLPTPGSDNPIIERHPYPGFYNLISLYLRSSDNAKVDVLLVVLNTEGHDIATLQQVVTGLIEAKNKIAIKPLKKLFSHPRSSNEQNPMLRQKLARAVMELGGGDECGWLRKQFENEANSSVRRTLGQLLKAHCG